MSSNKQGFYINKRCIHVSGTNLFLGKNLNFGNDFVKDKIKSYLLNFEYLLLAE